MTHLKINDAMCNAFGVITKIMTEAKATCLWRVGGPNGSALEGWTVGKRVVIVQAFKEGGWSHYLQSENDNNLADATIELLTLRDPE
jgi:hypothetical protein